MKFLPRLDVIIKQLRISLLPLILAISYASYQFWVEGDPKSFTTFINYFAAGFFFLMWLVGQYLRTAKQIDDATNYQDIQIGLTEVKESLNSLQKFQVTTTTETTSNTLLEGAKSAIENGHVLAGLMQAGVALEQAIINKAKAHGIYRDERMPVSKAINSLRNVLPEGVIGELFALWKLRNQLVHLTPEASQELETRTDLIKYFEWAISELEK
ncbi:MAG: hypothetical protein JXQ90_24165 [Cyclobacteriaceae bacterium]